MSDFFDFSIYVDARTEDIKELVRAAVPAPAGDRVRRPESYFHRYASLSDDEAVRTAEHIWTTINEPNLVENILPTRARATLVLTKERRPRRPSPPAAQALGVAAAGSGG